jgi:hypothetical protein
VVEAELAGHEGFREELDLAPGEDVSLSVSLPPIERTDLAVKAFDSFGEASGGILRVDGLYSGPLPLDVSLPRNRLSFVQAEIGADLSASAVVRGDDPGTVRLNLTPACLRKRRPPKTRDGNSTAPSGASPWRCPWPSSFPVSPSRTRTPR